jgi:hypothetical protein
VGRQGRLTLVAALALLGALGALALAPGPASGRGVVDDLLAALLGGGSGGGGQGDDGGGGSGSDAGARPLGGALRTASTGNRSELTKTIPIGRRANAKRRVVMSLGPGGLGELRDGDALYATAEVEVSVCLKPNRLHGSNRSCVGRMYGYDPTVRAELVLGRGGKARGGGRTVSLARRKLTCKQRQPHRNHHCVLVITNGVLRVGDAQRLPCNAETCHVNLVLSASDGKARRGHKLVVGAASNGRSVKGDKGRINISRFRPGHGRQVSPIVTRAKVRKRLPIAGEGGSVDERAIYSVALPELRGGEQLIVDGKLETRIGMHPYNVFQRTALVLSEGPRSASRKGWASRVETLNGQISEGNGFNCTQGKSAHRNPCEARKVGIVRVSRDAPKTLYLNLVAGMAAQADFNGRHRGGDKAKVGAGFLRVYRFPRDRNDSPFEIRD